MNENNPSSIDAYITQFPSNIQQLLQSMRKTIHDAIPTAKEKMAYGMPTFELYGNVVHFAAFTNHIGFYPAPSGIEHFKVALEKYQTGKGTLQFPMDEPLPLEIVREIAIFRAAENTRKMEEKKGKKK